jgi:nicotinamidase/pyrazinamidase
MNHTVDRRFFVGGLSAAALLAALPARAAKVKPGADAALIVVDVQNCFVTGGTRAARRWCR